MILKRRADIDRFLAAPGPEIRAALIHGRDMGVVRERARTLAEAATARPDDPFDCAMLTAAEMEADASRLHAELAAVSMMGGRRLVRLRLGDEETSADRAAAEALADHLAGKLNPDAFLLIEAGALARNSALKTLAEKSEGCAAIACWEDEPEDVARFARQSLAEEGLSLSPEALELFVSRLPHARGVVRQEIERLALYLSGAGGRAASAADLADFLGVEPEASLFEAANDAYGARIAPALAGLRRAAREGQSGPAVVRAVSLHHTRLRRVLAQAAAGTPLSEAVKRAGVFWKAEREFIRQARLWTLEALERLQEDILDADMACKSAGAPDDLIAERLILSIAGRARRLGL
jgi:DNA polymerase-3 subunit delta